eukprot:Lithocolla_globosa_v1_NODE_6758_length_1039_cov_4.481707.p2 type:complete len:116 gc:universal NODE_6758_length_1039_cov_4.481707:857-510(-)
MNGKLRQACGRLFCRTFLCKEQVTSDANCIIHVHHIPETIACQYQEFASNIDFSHLNGMEIGLSADDISYKLSTVSFWKREIQWTIPSSSVFPVQRGFEVTVANSSTDCEFATNS